MDVTVQRANSLKTKNAYKCFHGTMVPGIERALLFFGEYQVSIACPSDKRSFTMKLCVENLCNDTDRRNPKCAERNLSQ